MKAGPLGGLQPFPTVAPQAAAHDPTLRTADVSRKRSILPVRGDRSPQSLPSTPGSGASLPPLPPSAASGKKPTVISGRELHQVIGSGGEKIVYRLRSDPGRVIAMPHASAGGNTAQLAQRLQDQAALLDRLAQLGFDVPKNDGLATVDGRPGLLMEYIEDATNLTDMAMQSNEVIEKAVAGLDKIATLLQESSVDTATKGMGMHVKDFEVVMTRNGRVAIIDPMGMGPGVRPEQIDDLAKRAQTLREALTRKPLETDMARQFAAERWF